MGCLNYCLQHFHFHSSTKFKRTFHFHYYTRSDRIISKTKSAKESLEINLQFFCSGIEGIYPSPVSTTAAAAAAFEKLAKESEDAGKEFLPRDPAHSLTLSLPGKCLAMLSRILPGISQLQNVVRPRSISCSASVVLSYHVAMRLISLPGRILRKQHRGN